MTTAAEKKPPTVYTIPSSAPFVDSLAAGIRTMIGDDPRQLAQCTVLLPTRRARRALQEAFLRLSEGRALLLPQLRTLGDLDEDELTLSGAHDDPGLGLGFDLPPAIGPTRRRLLLSKLIMASDHDIGPDQAAWLAAELAKLLDQVHRERLGFEKLADLVPDKFAGHWQLTLDFMKILTDHWPAILADEQCIDPAERTNKLLETQAELWTNDPPDGPVIAAGSTGTIPATADLLGVVARLPHGMVVLPGFDGDVDEKFLNALGPTHPQYAMAQLIGHLGIDADDVQPWPHSIEPNSPIERAPLVREALKPPAVSDGHDIGPLDKDQILAGLSWIDCPTPQEEAGVIALVMRETLETPGRTAALVTPDRALARRVAAALKRWDIDIDDSAGQPLAQTPPGTFLRLTADMAADDLAPVALLAALKHPLAAGGQSPGGFRHEVRRLERLVLRGPRPAPSLDGLRAALESKGKNADAVLNLLEQACTQFIEALAQPNISLRDLVRLHVAMAEQMAASDTETGAERLWAHDDGEAAAGFIAELAEDADVLGAIPGRSYPALLDAFMAARPVRPRYGKHPRLFIWGLLEARLQRADVMILGGLNEGTWPPDAVASPWMSRPMLDDFGLPAPERHIGLTAHDFAQAFAAPRVVLTRAARVDGTPSVPSRWLLKIENLLDAAGLMSTLDRGRQWLAWQDRLDKPKRQQAVEPPAPTPPVEARPRRLSVSRIETLIRDPYAVYAEQVLKLKPLDAVDADPGAADRGILIHDALDRFVSKYPDRLPDEALDKLIDIGHDVFAGHMAWPGVQAIWWPRFERIADWFIEFERARHQDVTVNLVTEAIGEAGFETPAGEFRLTARADRIDRLATGALAVLDYKTGQAPTWPQVESGLVPQLSLEAALVEAGNFTDVPAAAVHEITYVRLTGGRTPGEIRTKNDDIGGLAAAAWQGLQKLIAAFDNPRTPYRSRPRPMFWHRYGDYDHLARVKEWSSGDGDGS